MTTQDVGVSVSFKPKDPIDRWICELTPDRSFVDIGGIGVDAANERIGIAMKAGASRATMADIRPFDFHEWRTFEDKMGEAGLSGYDKFEKIDINDTQLHERLPVFDIVHCTGILYHLANPVAALANVCMVVGEYLIVNTITIPEVVENEQGRLEFRGNCALFLPGISENERRVLLAHYRPKFTAWDLDDFAPRLDDADAALPYMNEDGFSCWPHWWLFTDSSFRSLVRLMKFQILDEWKWENHTLCVLAKRQRS